MSGSVSYIFNNYTSGGKSFSSLVKEAQEMGYTEPDPREDLSGSDVRRKILILAREAGYNLEEDEIQIIPLLNDKCLSAGSVEAFFEELTLDNKRFNDILVKAEHEDKRLRFIASLNNGTAELKLQAVDITNPFYALSGSDNMIVIYSERYDTTPFVIRGAGAGADVTAAGILAEIIGIFSYN